VLSALARQAPLKWLTGWRETSTTVRSEKDLDLSEWAAFSVPPAQPAIQAWAGSCDYLT